MRFGSGMYTHPGLLDTMIRVDWSMRLPNGDFKLYIRWFNNRGMDLGFDDKIRIKKDAVRKWRPVRKA